MFNNMIFGRDDIVEVFATYSTRIAMFKHWIRLHNVLVMRPIIK